MMEDAQRQRDLLRQRRSGQLSVEQTQQTTTAGPAASVADQAMADGLALARAQSIEAGKLVAAGDCDGAKRYALEQGTLVLAHQIKTSCSDK